jgi:hypothetical protein
LAHLDARSIIRLLRKTLLAGQQSKILLAGQQSKLSSAGRQSKLLLAAL